MTTATFMAELPAFHAAHPLVSVEVALDRGGAAWIEQIWSEVERGAGHAGRAMAALLDLADRHEVALLLSPRWLAYDIEWMEDEAEADRLHALNQRKLGNDEIEAWYGRLGFVRTGRMDGDHPVMERPPGPAPVPSPGP